jgi:hypothetical protein
MPPTPTFTPAVIGETEKALNGILVRELEGTGLTEPQWVTLSVAVAGSGTADADEFARRVAGVFKVGDAEARALIDSLADAQLLEIPAGDGSPVNVTVTGQELHGRIRNATGPIIRRLWGDLPADDLALAARVLTTIRERADAELATQG